MLLGIAVAIMSITFSVQEQLVKGDDNPMAQSSETESGDVEILKVDQPALLTGAGTITLVHEWHVLMEVLLPELPAVVNPELADRFTSELFRTLFERIISPNAP